MVTSVLKTPIVQLDSDVSVKTEQVLLISPKESYLLGSPPLGIGYLVSYSNSIGKNEVLLHDENFIEEGQLEANLNRAVIDFQPTFVGISFPSSSIVRVVEIIRQIKLYNPDIIIFAGGYHPTSDPEATLRAIPQLDFIVLDQAEYTFAHMGENWRSLPSVAYINETGDYVHNCVENPIESLDSIPFVDRSIFDARYFYPRMGTISGIYGKTATLMSSRGCPYRCSFCSIELLQKKVEYHGVDYVIGEIDSILTTLGNVDYFYFLDVMFLTKWARVEELCEQLIKSRILKNIKWAATVASNVISHDKVKLMKEAGCFYLSFGFESNSEKVLKRINKVATPKHNQNALDVCGKLGILVNSAFLFGVPGETEEDLDKTVQFVKKNNIFATGINMMKPLPGSPFYYEFLKKGLIKRDIETWHKISSIHHQSENFNPELSPDIYTKQQALFYRSIKYKNRWNDFSKNIKLKMKYKLFPSLVKPKDF